MNAVIHAARLGLRGCVVPLVALAALLLYAWQVAG